MTEYINKAELMENYPEFDGYTFADVTTIDIVHCGECAYNDCCSHGGADENGADWFCADGERRK